MYKRFKNHFISIFFCLSLVKMMHLPADDSKKYVIINHPVYNPGMFCVLNMVVAFLYQYEQGKYAGLKVDFGKNGLYYDANQGPNWWQYYFEPLQLGNRDEGVTIPFSDKNCSLDNFTQKNLTRRQVFSLIQKHIKLKDNIQNELDVFVDNHFKKNNVIGIHYRGTDKHIEAPVVSYKKVKNTIDKEIKNRGLKGYKLFVATDDQRFLDYLNLHFRENIICQDIYRSQDGTALHLNGSNHPYQLGKEALLDCLLLSKTELLIRTDSRLSLWSAYFNPKMKVITLNTNYYIGRTPDGL